MKRSIKNIYLGSYFTESIRFCTWDVNVDAVDIKALPGVELSAMTEFTKS